jgi:hypothetical protein
MMERAYLNGGQSRYNSDRAGEFSPAEPRFSRHSKKVKWRFKPRPLGMLIVMGLFLFCVGRLVAIPFVEGVYHYYSKTRELATLQQRSHTLTKQLAVLRKTLKYMQTDAYVEEKGHQIGMIKENESQMVVVDPEMLKCLAKTRKAKEELYKD